MKRNGDSRVPDPGRDPGGWERRVAAIVAAAEPELRRRRRTAELPELVLQWARPALATAATVALLLSAAALMRGGDTTAVATADPSLAGAVVPERYAAWLMAGYEPTVTELVVALEEVH